MAVSLRRSIMLVGILGLSTLVGACGGSDDNEAAQTTTTSAPRAALANACPPEGCRVRIVDVSRAGEELQVSFDANYSPDMSRNHFHVFWDTFTAKQVSDDAERRFGVTQGDWVPTADNPFTTQDVVSVKVRGGAKRICVTAGDRDHNVLDPELVDCRDVTGVLGG